MIPDNHAPYMDAAPRPPEPMIRSANANRKGISMIRRVFIISSALALGGLLAACSDSGNKQAGGAAGPGGAAQQAAPVGVVALKKDTFPVTTILPGRAESYQTADIRPQVSGIIREIAFREGGEVKKGDLLYQIEDAPYVATVEQAKAAIAKAEASVPSAQSNFDRYQRLVGSGATQIEFETAKTTLLQAHAEVESAKAALASAQIDLDHTKIVAPFDGVIDETAFNVGNVVAANQTTALTTIRQLDPIYISLTESSTNLLKLRDAMRSAGVQGADAVFRLILENGKEYNQKGKLDMSQQIVSETTGTFIIRVLFPNPDRVILPGMYVRATVELGAEVGYALPQLATSRDANGRLTAQFISADGKVETRAFENASPSNNSWLVTDGVKDGDQLIVSGLQSIASGMPVKPVPMKINESGVVVPAEQPAAGDAQKPAAQVKRKRLPRSPSQPHRNNLMAKFFIRRPIFAWVIAITIMLAGLLGIFTLSISQYPDIAPTTVRINATYRGASAETVEKSVTTIIEDGMTGLDDLTYMTSTSSTGSASISLTFGTSANPDIAQVQVQNKLQLVQSQLPGDVIDAGISVTRSTSSILLVGSLVSTDGKRNSVDLGNIMSTSIEDQIQRLEGVGSINIFGSGYAMRVWLDPFKLQKFQLTPSDVTSAIAGAEHPGLRRLARRAAGRQGPAAERHDHRAEPADHRRRFRAHHPESGKGRLHRPPQRRLAHRNRPGKLRRLIALQRPAVERFRRQSRDRRQRHRYRRPRSLGARHRSAAACRKASRSPIRMTRRPSSSCRSKRSSTR